MNIWSASAREPARLEFPNAQGMGAVDHHVTTCDLPETAKTWLTLGRKAGFANVAQLFLDPTGFYGLYRYDV